MRNCEVRFDFKTLERNDGEKVGSFRDWSVIATTKKAFFNRENTQGAYLIYDDGNKLVFNGKVCGTIGIDGKVNYSKSEYRYVQPQEPILTRQGECAAFESPAGVANAEVKLENGELVESLLKYALETTVEQMLEG